MSSILLHYALVKTSYVFSRWLSTFSVEHQLLSAVKSPNVFKIYHNISRTVATFCNMKSLNFALGVFLQFCSIKKFYWEINSLLRNIITVCVKILVHLGLKKSTFCLRGLTTVFTASNIAGITILLSTVWNFIDKWNAALKYENSNRINDALNIVTQLQIFNFFMSILTTFSQQIVSYLSCFFISLSIAAFCVSTLPGIREDGEIVGSPNGLSVLEIVCSSFFTLEFLMRVIFCPSKLLFFKRPMNWIDLISILPFYVSFLTADEKVKMFLVIRVMRLLRYVSNIVTSRRDSPFNKW